MDNISIDILYIFFVKYNIKKNILVNKNLYNMYKKISNIKNTSVEIIDRAILVGMPTKICVLHITT